MQGVTHWYGQWDRIYVFFFFCKISYLIAWSVTDVGTTPVKESRNPLGSIQKGNTSDLKPSTSDASSFVLIPSWDI